MSAGCTVKTESLDRFRVLYLLYLNIPNQSEDSLLLSQVLSASFAAIFVAVALLHTWKSLSWASFQEKNTNKRSS